MFTGNEDMEASALRAQGWSISAIARHLGRNRETIRNHLNGTRVPGVRRAAPDPFEPFVPYLRERLGEDPHVWASALYDEVTALGFTLSYQSFTRGMRRHALRPHCEACDGVKGRATIEIEHPPGEEVQWDWVELGEAPWGGDAHLLVGSLPCSGKFRGVFAESEDQAHLIEAMDGVLRRLGGNARRWRVDRMATVVDPKTGIVQPSFVPVAKHYGATVVACPPRRGNRKGSVEKSNHFATQRFWRTMTATRIDDAQRQLDRFCERTGDGRPRSIAKLEELVGHGPAVAFLAERGRKRPRVGDLAELERLRPLLPGEHRRAQHRRGLGPRPLRGQCVLGPPGSDRSRGHGAPPFGHRRHRDHLCGWNAPGQPRSQDSRRWLRGARPRPQGRLGPVALGREDGGTTTSPYRFDGGDGALAEEREPRSAPSVPGDLQSPQVRGPRSGALPLSSHERGPCFG